MEMLPINTAMDFWAIKHNGTLYPASDEDKQSVNKLSADEPILLTHRRSRNPKLHRKYFAFINLVYENLPEKFEQNWPTQRSFRKAMEMYAGHFEETVSLKGERIMMPKSIAYHKLDDIAFGELFQGVKRIIGKHILPNVEAFAEEIERFYG